MSLKDDQNKIRASEAKKYVTTKERGDRFQVQGKNFITGQIRELRDGTKVKTTKTFFGNMNTGSGTFYAERLSDGRKIKVRADDFKPAKSGAPSLVDKKVNKAKALNKAFAAGTVTDLKSLKQSSVYQSSTDEQKKELIRQTYKMVPDKKVMNREKKEKVVTPKKSAGTFDPKALEKIKTSTFKAAGAGARPNDFDLGPKLISKEELNRARRTMSQRRFIQEYPGEKYASGGMVNAKLGAFVEVQNNFSDRMLPNKKRTTRIY